MKILITGGAGFLGTRLARALVQRGELAGRTIKELVLVDKFAPFADLCERPGVRFATGDLLTLIPQLDGEIFDVVFHLAAATSAECEADFDLGMRSNLDTTRALLDLLRASATHPKFIFASSVAVFGSTAHEPMPPKITDTTPPLPQSSYGSQKFICEQLVADYTRKDFIDGRVARLMTVAIRPGRPNGAASSFLSSIVREPLHGETAVCPVPLDMQVVLASPAHTIEGLIGTAEADRQLLDGYRAVNLPGLTVSAREMLDTLEAVGGAAVRALVRFEIDADITRIVGGWPSAFDTILATKLGLVPDSSFRSIVEQFMREDAAAQVAVAGATR
jgi:nucleoside-diphosphate-sugar epimerase